MARGQMIRLDGAASAGHPSPTSSPRRRGPITTVAPGSIRRLPHRLSQRPVAMGPRLRGDDTFSAETPGLISIMLHSALINVMVKAARRAGRSLKRDLGEVEHLQVSLKGPANFVTKAD